MRHDYEAFIGRDRVLKEMSISKMENPLMSSDSEDRARKKAKKSSRRRGEGACGQSDA